MKKYLLFAVLTNSRESKIKTAQCEDRMQALLEARDLAWEFYMEREGTEDLPSYQMLVDQLEDYTYIGAIDDAYVRSIEANVEYWVDEIPEEEE